MSALPSTYNAFNAFNSVNSAYSNNAPAFNNTAKKQETHQITHPDGDYTRFKVDAENGKIEAIKINYSDQGLPEAIISKKDGEKEKLIMPVDKDIIEYLDKNDIVYEYNNKKPSMGEKLANTGKIVFQEGMAPIIAMGVAGGLFLAGKNSIDKIMKMINYKKAIESTNDTLGHNEELAKRVYDSLKNTTEAIVGTEGKESRKKVYTGLKNSVDTGISLIKDWKKLPMDSGLFFIEGVPGSGKTYMSKLLFNLGKEEKNLNILSINAGPENASTIMTMLQDLVTGKNSERIIKAMDSSYKRSGGKGDVHVLKIFADEITNPAFSDLTNNHILKSVLQDKLVIKLKKATKGTCAAIAASVVSGMGLLGLSYKKAKKESDKNKTDLFGGKNVLKMGSIITGTALLAFAASKFKRQEVQRQMKALIYATGNSVPDGFLDPAIARRMIHVKMSHINMDVASEKLADTIKQLINNNIVNLDVSEEIIRKVVKESIEHPNIFGKVDYSTFESSRFLSYLGSTIKDLNKPGANAEEILSKSIMQTLNDIHKGTRNVNEISNKPIQTIGEVFKDTLAKLKVNIAKLSDEF